MDPVADAIEAIDDANRQDPHRHDGEPLALLQGRMAHDWATRLDPRASDAVRLATRAHHLRRWVVPRDSYPEGRAGYLRWRRDQQRREADELRGLLAAAGVDEATTDRAATIVTKTGLGTDTDVQLFEDAVCLTFLSTQLTSTAERLDPDRMIDVIAKTLTKMSAGAIAAVASLDLAAADRDLIERAVEGSGASD